MARCAGIHVCPANQWVKTRRMADERGDSGLSLMDSMEEGDPGTCNATMNWPGSQPVPRPNPCPCQALFLAPLPAI